MTTKQRVAAILGATVHVRMGVLMQRSRMLRVVLAAIVAALVTSGALVVAAPAQASGSEFYMDVATGWCLGSSGNGYNPHVLDTKSCSKNDLYYSVYWVPVAFGSYREIRSTLTGYCVDSNANRQAYLNPCGNGGNDYQLWLVTQGPNGSIQFQSKATGYCLDSNAARQVYTNPCGYYNQYQQWV